MHMHISISIYIGIYRYICMQCVCGMFAGKLMVEIIPWFHKYVWVSLCSCPFVSCCSCWESNPQQVCCTTTELSPIIIHTKICWLLQSAYYIIIQSVMLLIQSVILVFKVCHVPVWSVIFPSKVGHVSIQSLSCSHPVSHAPTKNLSCSYPVGHTPIQSLSRSHPVSHVPTQNLSCSCPKSVMFPSKACHIHALLTHCCKYTLKLGEMS